MPLLVFLLTDKKQHRPYKLKIRKFTILPITELLLEKGK